MTEMRRLLSKIDEMKTQRAALEKQFRDDIQKDDITSVLMAVDSTKEVNSNDNDEVENVISMEVCTGASRV